MTEAIDAKSAHVAIAGGNGFLGEVVARDLTSRGVPVQLIARHKPHHMPQLAWHPWDGCNVGDWAVALEGAAALINLSGRTVDCRKTPDHADDILRSRVDSVRTLGEACRQANSPPPVWIQAATAHIYGDPPERICDEHAATGYGLAPDVGRAWEAAFHDALPDGIRGLLLRTSLVLGRNGGALPVLTRLARLGLGGRIGSGRQWLSWLHETDFCEIVHRMLTDETMSGIYNLTAPAASRQQDFMKTLRRVLRQPLGLPATEGMVRFGARFILNTDPELALYGRHIRPARLLDEGYIFHFTNLETALKDLFAPDD